jgi:hypothetical protein
VRKIKTIIKEIPCSPYSVCLWLVISNNPDKELKKLCKKYPDLDFEWEEGVDALTMIDFYKDNYLLVVFDANSSQMINTICHEVVHIKNRIYSHAGTTADPDNDEPEAYLSGWLAEQIESAWQEWKKLK